MVRWFMMAGGCLLGALALLQGGCASSSGGYPAYGSKDDPHAPVILEAPVQSVLGPKRTLAVGKFTTIGSLAAKYGEWDLGGGFAAMLTTALVETGDFIVLERAELDKIMTELQMAGEGVSAEGSGPDLGQLYGAQFLVFGAVTKFGTDFSGGGMSMGAHSLGQCPHMQGSVSGAIEKAKGAIGMDIRIVDTTTGAVVSSLQIEEPIFKIGKDFSAEYGKFSIGGNKFMRTPVGDAARKAITHIVMHIADAAGEQQWVGRVVDVESMNVIINAGNKAGIEVGSRFVVDRVNKRFTDPVTGRLLGVRKETLGLMEVELLEDELAFGTFQPMSDILPKRGDLVVLQD